MYIINFEQQSNCTTWLEEFSLVAADDLTPISANEIEIQMQIWARSSRGGGDQSQLLSYNSFQGLNRTNIPLVNATTNDGTGRLVLNDGTLIINVDFPNMAQILPGYYEVGLTMFRDGISQQLAVGLLPIYNGGVFTQFPIGGLP